MSGRGSYQDRLEGRFSAGGSRFALIVARFNASVTDALLRGATECLTAHGAEPDSMEVFRVPGAWELAQAAEAASRTGRFQAILALGCVIRGETPHFEYIAAEAARGLGAVARSTRVPVIFGVLTTETLAQAEERASPGGGNKGREAALAALEMIDLFRRLEGEEG